MVYFYVLLCVQPLWKHWSVSFFFHTTFFSHNFEIIIQFERQKQFYTHSLFTRFIYFFKRFKFFYKTFNYGYIIDKFDWKSVHKTRNVLKTRLNFKEFYFYIFSFFQINIKKKYSIKIKIHFYSIIFIPVPFENNLSYCPYRIFPQFFRMHFILFLHSFHLHNSFFF